MDYVVYFDLHKLSYAIEMATATNRLTIIGYNMPSNIPKKPGPEREDQSLKTWSKHGDLLTHHLDTKNKKVVGSKRALVAAVNKGVDLLSDKNSKHSPEEVVGELNQLKEVLGKYWTQWLASIRHEKNENNSRVTVTFDVDKRLLAILNIKSFTAKDMENLQSAIIACEFKSIDDFYDLLEFFEQYRASREEHKQATLGEEGNVGHAVLTMKQMKKLFHNAKADDFEQLKSVFAYKQKVINKSAKFDRVRQMINSFDGTGNDHEKLVDDLRDFVNL